MLRIVIEGQDTDLAEDIAINMTLTCPIFAESGFDEIYSYSFSLPKSAKNKKIFSKYNGKFVKVQILFSNYLITEGIGKIKASFSNFSVDFKNQSIDIRQKIENISLKEIPLDTIEVCAAVDSPTVKLQKWQDHMTKTTVTDSSFIGSHKFPHIKAWDDAADSGYFTEWYVKNPAFQFDVNNYWNGTFIKNVGYPLAYNSSQPAWWGTVSPCIKIQYLFDKLIEHLSVTVGVNELASITEFRQMIHYSLLAMDKVEGDGTSNFNVHGTTINLSKFVPDLKGSDLLKMLDEQFGVFFNFSNSKLNVRLKSNILKTKAIDYSKYCNETYNIDIVEKQSYVFIYPIDLTQLDRYSSFIWDYSVFVGGVPVTLNKHKNRQIGSTEAVEELTLSYIPMQTRINFIDRVYPATYSGTIAEEVAVTTDMFIPFDQKSSFYDLQKYNEGGINQFIVGLVRGVYPIYNYTNSVWNNRVLFCNSNKLDDVDSDQDVNYIFGTCSIFLKDADSHVDVYLKNFYQYLRIADEVSKVLYLPLHKILSIMEWKEPNHVIKQRNLSFKGTVKELSFTLYKSSISPCTIKYAVVEKEALNDYNNDFNDDYLN
jgi:hypothetical protein